MKTKLSRKHSQAPNSLFRTPHSALRTAITAAMGVSLLLPAAFAADWPRWGGNDPGRNMYSPAAGLPDHFDVGKFKKGSEEVDLSTTKNVKWAAQLGSQAFGNVVVSGGKVFVGTNNENPRDPQHTGDRSILMCFDEKTGEFLWQLVVPKLAAGKVNDWEGLGLLSSPCVEGNRLYVVTSRCEVVCLDTEGMANGNDGPFMDEAQYVVGPGKPKAKIGPKDADIIWRYDMMDELGVFPHNASNCSILIIGDVIYVCTSNGQDWTHSNIPSPNSPSFIALDKHSGKLLGEDDAHIGPHIFHGQWSSPSTGVVNGKQLVFFGGGNGFCYAFDAKPVKEGDDSFLKTVWKFDCNPPKRWGNDPAHKYPGAEGPSEINATPVFYKNRVYVPVGQDPEHGEGVGNLTCIDATQTGDVTKTAKIWSYSGIHRSLSTVAIDPKTGLLFVGDFSGYVHCLDAETGKLYWTHDMKAHIWGSTLVADGKVYIGDEDGDFVVMAASKEKKIISTTNLGAAVYSTPVVANGVIYVGSQTHLYAFYDQSKVQAHNDEPAKLNIPVK
jgi:outer membrane protein assembly factor BamB